MCGIAGFTWPGTASDPRAVVDAMGATLTHRGPDCGDSWVDAEAGVALNQQRLAIIDLSPAGNQPMFSASGRYVIVYNGEIYNHPQLRAEIEAAGHSAAWRGHSDTETLLAGIDLWGLEATLVKAVGMFAIALWDRKEKTLHLARDRAGEKPLYYGWVGTGAARAFIFGSELKALKQHPGFDRPVDRGALSLFLRHNYIPAPYSIYEGISKLTPGHILSLRPGADEPMEKSYWSTVDVARKARSAPFKGTIDDGIEQLDALLRDAVQGQMLSDVPLGAFLSGGVDSSTIVALMQQLSSAPVKTFTIGFSEEAFNEAEYAKAVANHLGTDHTELYVSPQQALDVVPRLSTIYDEPFADSSQIPTFLVSQLARKSVTVSLSGDAGDELFGGYNRYAFTDRLWSRIGWLAPEVRRPLARALQGLSPSTWDQVASPLKLVVPRSRRQASIGDKIHKGAGVLASADADELYHRLVSHWRSPESIVVGGREPPTSVSRPPKELDGFSGIERMMALDTITYLPDDILAKVDRAAMAVSLETRVPLLDHRVIEFAWRLPMSMKLRGGETKWLLRQVLYRYVPKSMIERPKTGFGVPLASWLRGELRDWAETLLDAGRLRQEGYFNPVPIREKWDEHLAGDRNWAYHLWDVLMFQAWLEAE